MAKKISQRGELMRKNFLKLRNEGMSIPEIAKKYGVVKATLYNCLEEIAKENGVSRESLLKFPHKSHEKLKGTGHKGYLFDSKEVTDLISESYQKIRTLINSIDDALKGEN